MINMSKDDLTMFEQHIGTVAWIIVIGLLTWNVTTTNSMQIQLATFTTKIEYLSKRVDMRSSDTKELDDRMYQLEKRISNIESGKEFGKR